MVELGQLEAKHAEFAQRNVKVVVISNDDQPTSQLTQKDFPHLVVVADTDQSLARAVQVIHAGAGHEGEDTNAPTVFLIDGTGTVRWWSRPDSFMVRHAPEELLAVIDSIWPKE